MKPYRLKKMSPGSYRVFDLSGVLQGIVDRQSGWWCLFDASERGERVGPPLRYETLRDAARSAVGATVL